MAKKKSEYTLDLPCSFGNLSVGDKTTRISVTIDRGNLSVAQADKHLCERRLSGRLVAKPAGWKADENALPGMDEDVTVDGVFDVKAFSVSSDHINAGLTFAIRSVELEALAKFAKREGRIQIETVGEIPDADKNDESEE